MADLSQQKTYNGAYSGLVKNLYVTIGIAGIFLIGHEIEVHVRRRRGRDGTFQRIPVRIFHAAKRALQGRGKGADRRRRKDEPRGVGVAEVLEGANAENEDLKEARRRLGGREGWEFGYIFQPRAWARYPSPPVPKWPLAWIWTSLRVKEKDMPQTCGLDVTLHMRFLRGSLTYTFLQVCVVLPILMPLHILYAPDNIEKTSMLRAGISSLVDTSGSRWLWVHTVLIWWVTITWLYTVLWVTWGALGYRKRELLRLEAKVKAARFKRETNGGDEGENRVELDDWTLGEDSEGIKKFKTVMMTNVPPDMRDESVLRDYFDHYIHFHRNKKGDRNLVPRLTLPVKKLAASPWHTGSLLKKKKEIGTPPLVKDISVDPKQIPEPGVGVPAPEDASSGEEGLDSEVEEIVLVRKLSSLQSLRQRRTAVQRDLEIAHIKLARRILSEVSKHIKHLQSKARKELRNAGQSGLAEKGPILGGLARLKASVTSLSKEERLDRLTEALGGYVNDEPLQLGSSSQTVWDVLHSLPRELIDPYQALSHLKVTSVFRNQNAPLIDYLTTKLLYLTALVDEARSEPLEQYPAASTAFITFKDARTARLALKILDSHPKRSLACHLEPAVDWQNLLWPRLGKSVYKSSFVRGWVVFLGVWAFTLVWIFPVSLFCALTSLTNIADFIPSLKSWIDAHPDAASTITSLGPVVLVASLTLSICPILLLIANKAETINTRLGIHNSVLERFWKFLMVNGVVFFAIGQTAIEAYLAAFQTKAFDPLPVVASAFPIAAPYFASYILLQVAIQPCFEMFRFGLATIVYVFGTRRSIAPRQRNSRTEYPTFSHFSQVPQQILAGAIMHLFMLLNPLVIPFTLIYYSVCYVVWKRQFTYVYGRMYENNGRRTSIRVLRYSLDALALGQFVLFAFFILNKAKGSAIATGILFFLTLGAKLVITRALKLRFDNLDTQEADLLCPPVGEADVTDDDGDQPDAKQHAASGTAAQSSLRWLWTKTRNWVLKWAFAAGHRSTPTGYRKPIPFDHLLFTVLDKRISDRLARRWKEDRPGRPVYTRDVTVDAGRPDEADIEAVVVPHPPLQPWEDVPPYQRARGYDDQPAYTDGYDDFLWLPRDPLSTLDLDDTVQMRLSLTTSIGGIGKFGEWPIDDTETQTTLKTAMVDLKSDSTGHPAGSEEVLTHPFRVVSGGSSGEGSEEVDVGAQNNESLRLMPIPTVTPPSPTTAEEALDIPATIGSEAGDTAAAMFRTIRLRQTISRAFRRPQVDGDDEDADPISPRSAAESSLRRRISITSPTSIQATPDPSETTAETRQDEDGPTGGINPLVRRTSSQSRPSVPILAPPIAGPSSPTPADLFAVPKTAPAGSRVNFPDLSRTASARKPPLARANSRSSAGGARVSSLGSPAMFVGHLLAHSHAARDRSVSATSHLSAQQRALLQEVMAEERLARKDHAKEERAEQEREEIELKKEKERDAANPSSAAAATLGQPGGAFAASSLSVPQTRLGRSGTVLSAGSRRSSRMVHGPPQSQAVGASGTGPVTPDVAAATPGPATAPTNSGSSALSGILSL